MSADVDARFPAAGDDGFETADPAEAGVDPDDLADAVEFHLTHGTPREQVAYDFSNREPWDESEGELGYRLGPMPDRRGGPAGVVLRDGRLLTEWGDTRRVDHCFSVAKSFLSLTAGVAYDRGLIGSVDDRVGESVGDGGFDSEHNASITWRQFLEGTSEWEGELFDRPDTVDRNRGVGRTDGPGKGTPRELREPGSYWEYNDVRINRLALSLLRVHAKPLPRVLAHEVMDPVGATRSWEWHGYHNSDVTVEGRPMRSVSGGGHWGGGLWASTLDLARAGRLLAAGGRWGDDRLLSEEWVEMATTPCAENPTYGFLLWLNTDRTLWPAAPASSFAMLGHGSNVVWVDPDDDLVVVLRWVARREDAAGRADKPNQNAFLDRLLAGVE